MKYEIKFSCGHTATVELTGLYKDRQRKIEWYENSGLCPECKKEANRIKDLQLVEKYNPVPLRGSVAQIKWAEEIRLRFIKLFDTTMKDYQKKLEAAKVIQPSQYEDGAKEAERLEYLARHLIANVAESKYFIDNRDDMQYLYDLLTKYEKSILKEKEIPSSVAETEAREAITIRPESETHTGVVEIKIEKDTIYAFYHKDEDFRNILKSLYYYWDGEIKAWCKNCTEFSGNITDRAAELINSLLLNGFSVMCLDDAAREKAVSATFDPEIRKQITFSSATESFSIKCDYTDKELYSSAGTLPDAKRMDSKGRYSVSVPARNWREVDDFAYIHNFKLSAEATAAIEKLKVSQFVVSPSLPPEPIKETDKLQEILNSNNEILEDLKDND